MKLTSSKNFGKTLKDKTDSEYRRLRDNYDHFIGQSLILGMFIPCDEDGNILEEPKDYDLGLKFPYSNNHSIECEKYQQAKERVLFEGWELIHRDKVRITIECDCFQLDWAIAYNSFDHYLTIENLSHLNFELTQSAIKQIGL